MAALDAVINEILKIDPNHGAIEFQSEWWSWADVNFIKQGIDAAIEASGLDAGCRVGIFLRNRPELVSSVLAIFAAKNCLVTLNAAYPDDALIADIQKEGLSVLIASEVDFERETLRDAAFETGALCIQVPQKREQPVEVLQRLKRPVGAFDRPFNSGVAIEMLTSGTTGAPKRIPMPTTNFEKAVFGSAAFEKGRGEDDHPKLRSGVPIVVAPIAHIAGILAVSNAVVAGRSICLLEKFSVDSFHQAVVRHKPKVAGAPPAAIKMILDADIPPEDFSSIRAFRSGTAPLDPDMADRFYEKYKIPILQNYGATEFGGVAGWTIQDFQEFYKVKRGAVGRLNPGIEGRTLDPESLEVQALGQTGILELKGPQIGDGKSWVRTTDIAILDADLFLWIKGRADGAIVRGGFKIQPQDIVDALEKHPQVREAAATGIPDERLGQVPVAAVVPVEGADRLEDAELRAFLKERLLPYQMPIKILSVTDLPRTVSLKVSLPELKKLFLENA